MKINEFNKPRKQLEEASPTLAAIKGLFTGQGTHQTLVQDIFLQDFYRDAVTSLKNGIKGGLVNPELKSPSAPSAPETPTEPETPSSSPSGAPEPSPSPTAPGETPYKWSPKGSSITPDTKLSDIGPVGGKTAPKSTPSPAPTAPKSTPSPAPTAPKSTPGPTAAPTKPGMTSGPTPSTTPTPGSPITPKPATGTGVNRKPTSPTPSAPKAKPKPNLSPADSAKKQRLEKIVMMTRGRGLERDRDGNWSVSIEDPKDPEHSITYTYDDDYNLINTRGTRDSTPTKESTYRKLNKIFESIISEAEGPTGMSIGDYMKKWFSMYMQGVNWSASEQLVNDAITKLQDEYPKNFKQNLNNLGRMALALSKLDAPAGAPEQFKQRQQQQQQEVIDMTPEKLAATFKAMRPRDKQKAAELIKKAGG